LKKIDKRKKLSAQQVRAIRRAYTQRNQRRLTQQMLAERYEVDPSTISRIVIGHSRKHIGGARSFPTPSLATGSFNGMAKLSARQVRRIRERYETQKRPVTQTQLAEQYGVSSVAIHLIVREKSWRGIAGSKTLAGC
jgi:transcriptional regulator with XRE-family HTH domain